MGQCVLFFFLSLTQVCVFLITYFKLNLAHNNGCRTIIVTWHACIKRVWSVFLCATSFHYQEVMFSLLKISSFFFFYFFPSLFPTPVTLKCLTYFFCTRGPLGPNHFYVLSHVNFGTEPCIISVFTYVIKPYISKYIIPASYIKTTRLVQLKF